MVGRKMTQAAVWDTVGGGLSAKIQTQFEPALAVGKVTCAVGQVEAVS